MMLKKYTKRHWAIFTLVLLCVAGAVAYSLRTPLNDRDWSDDQIVLPYAVFRGDTVEVFNIRNFRYSSVSTYTKNYYDKVFSLDALASVDYIVEPFDNLGAAHTFLSFGFKDGSHLAISVEIRKEKGESFSPLRGLFREYELTYVVADERDVILLRTNHRHDEVFLYPVTATKEQMQALFIDMLTRANALRETPEFYNTLTNTCTTNIVSHVNTIAPKKIPYDIRLLLPKNSDELAYELGLIGTGTTSFVELRDKYRINEKAAQYGENDDFSKMIRTRD